MAPKLKKYKISRRWRLAKFLFCSPLEAPFTDALQGNGKFRATASDMGWSGGGVVRRQEPEHDRKRCRVWTTTDIGRIAQDSEIPVARKPGSGVWPQYRPSSAGGI